MDRRIVCAVFLAAWILWQEIQFLDQPGAPSWHLEGRFSGEVACHEARKIRLTEQLLGTHSGGPTVLNRPTIEDGVLWLQWPGGLSGTIRFVCLPDSIDPEPPWFGHQHRDPGGLPYASR